MLLQLKYIIIKCFDIGERAFYSCKNLNAISIGNISIGSEAFARSGVETLCFTKPATLGESVFEGCLALTTINFCESSISTIPKYAFRLCQKLEHITIPECVTSIGNGAFKGCSNIKTVVYNGVEDPGKGIYAFSRLVAVTVNTEYKDDLFCGIPVREPTLSLEEFYYWEPAILSVLIMLLIV